jgi:hypothetical protein
MHTHILCVSLLFVIFLGAGVVSRSTTNNATEISVPSVDDKWEYFLLLLLLGLGGNKIKEKGENNNCSRLSRVYRLKVAVHPPLFSWLVFIYSSKVLLSGNVCRSLAGGFTCVYSAQSSLWLTILIPMTCTHQTRCYPRLTFIPSVSRRSCRSLISSSQGIGENRSDLREYIHSHVLVLLLCIYVVKSQSIRLLCCCCVYSGERERDKWKA